MTLALSVFPALLVLASLFWFRGHSPWELVRTKPLEFIEHWVRAGAADQGATPADIPWTTRAGLFAAAMLKGMTPLFVLFTCIGAAGWKAWLRRDRAAMFCTVWLFLLAIWIHLSAAGETSSRYFVPVALMVSPLAASGLLACSRWVCFAIVARSVRRRPEQARAVPALRPIHAGTAQACSGLRLPRRPWVHGARFGLRWDVSGRLAAWAPIVLFAVFSLGNVAVSDYRQRAGHAELGRWIGSRFGPSPALLGCCGVTQVVSYYSHGHCTLLDPHVNDQVIENLLRQDPFNVVLLLDDPKISPGHSVLLRHAADLGYRPLDAEPFSDKLRNMIVLVRREPH